MMDDLDTVGKRGGGMVVGDLDIHAGGEMWISRSTAGLPDRQESGRKAARSGQEAGACGIEFRAAGSAWLAERPVRAEGYQETRRAASRTHGETRRPGTGAVG